MNTKKSDKTSFKMSHDYDAQNDSLFMYINDDYAYKRSLRLDNDLILDFDQNNVPVALEILHASRRLNTDKFHLRQPMGLKMEIIVGEDCIRIKAGFVFLVRNKPSPLDLTATGENTINLPSQEAHFEKAAA